MASLNTESDKIVRFSAEKGLLFGEMLDGLGQLTGKKRQSDIKEALGFSNINPSDLSKAKSGFAFGEEKWLEIKDKTSRYLQEIPADGDEWKARVAGRIRAIVEILDQPEGPSPFQLYPSDVGNDPDLEKGLLALDCSRRVNAELWEHLDTSELHLVSGSYSDDIRNVMEELQEALQAKISEINWGSQPKARRTVVGLSQQEADFGRIIRWASAQSRPLLCLFPFYLTSYRRLAWGVIRYARHTELGLVVPKVLMDRPSNQESDRPTIGPAEWETLLRGNALVYSLLGFASEEILCELTLSTSVDKTKLVRTFNQNNRPLFHELEHAIDRATKGMNIFAFDLVDEHLVREQIANKKAFQIVGLKHGLSIPVGIGFSLPLFPWIKDHFLALRKAALAAIDPQMEQCLSKVGIEIDRSLLRSSDAGG